MRQLGEIGAEARAARKRLGFHRVEDLARIVGVDRRRLSDFETGRKALPVDSLRILSEVLRLPRISSQVASVRRSGSREAEAGFLRLAKVSRPYYDPPRDRDQEVRRRAARQHEPELMEALELAHQGRADHEIVRTFLDSISSASWLEYLLPAQELVHPEAVPLRISPHEIGYRHYALVDPMTLQAVGDRLWPALGLRFRDLTVVQFFNATLRTPRRTWTVDLLQFSRQARKPPCWNVVEIDGEGHRTQWDLEREEQIALPTLRFTEEEVRAGDRWPCIERWLRGGMILRETPPG